MRGVGGGGVDGAAQLTQCRGCQRRDRGLRGCQWAETIALGLG